MISKEEFVRYIEIYKQFEDTLNKLDELHVSLWEDESVGRFCVAYVSALCQLTNVRIDSKCNNDIETYLYENREWNTPEELYDWIQSYQTKEEKGH